MVDLNDARVAIGYVTLMPTGEVMPILAVYSPAGNVAVEVPSFGIGGDVVASLEPLGTVR